MRLIALVISIILMSCNLKSQKEAEQKLASTSSIRIKSDSLKISNKDFQILLNDYDTSLVLNSYFFLFNSKEKVFDLDSLSYNFCEPLDSMVVKNKVFYLLKIDSIFSTNQTHITAKSLARWCENEALLNTLLKSSLNNNGKVYFEELIWELPEMQNILKKYLKTKEQYWGSLDVEQSCSLYIDVLFYLQSLGEKKRSQFFKSYHNILVEKLLHTTTN